MTAVLGVLAGGVLAAFIVALVVGLVSGRIPWRTRGCCCPVDPADDLRMRDAPDPSR